MSQDEKIDRMARDFERIAAGVHFIAWLVGIWFFGSILLGFFSLISAAGAAP